MTQYIVIVNNVYCTLKKKHVFQVILFGFDCFFDSSTMDDTRGSTGYKLSQTAFKALGGFIYVSLVR